MKLFGSIAELVSAVFRKNSQTITLRPNQTTTYTAARDVQFPEQDAASVLVSRTSTDTLTNKTLTSPVINTPTGITKSDVGLGNVDNTSDATKNAAAVQLTNKDIDGGAASNTRRITLPKDTTTNINALTRKQATLIYDTTTDQVKFDNGSVLTALATSSVATPTAQGTSTSYFATIQSSVKSVTSGDYTANVYTAGTTDGFETFLVTTGATNRTFALPAAASNTGRIMLIRKVDSGVGKLTIDPNSTELINGLSTFDMHVIGDFVNIACDGTGWYVTASRGTTGWTTFTPTTSWTTNVTQAASYRRVGSTIEIQFTAALTGAPSESGSEFDLTLPNSWTVDTTALLSTGGRTSNGFGTFYDSAANYLYGFPEVSNIGGGDNKIRFLVIRTSLTQDHTFRALSQTNNVPKAGLVNGDLLIFTVIVPLTQFAQWAT